jgi:hypothetical protein
MLDLYQWLCSFYKLIMRLLRSYVAASISDAQCRSQNKVPTLARTFTSMALASRAVKPLL